MSDSVSFHHQQQQQQWLQLQLLRQLPTIAVDPMRRLLEHVYAELWGPLFFSVAVTFAAALF